MKIFFAGSIRGGRSMLQEYIQMVDLLKKEKHTIVSEHVASENLLKIEAQLTDEEIFNNDTRYIDECDCLVAEVTIPSLGVGYEICYAVSRGKKVLCIYKEHTTISAMVRGNKNIMTCSYRNVGDLDHSFRLHLG